MTETTGSETVIGVVTRTYDGEGNFKQYDNLKEASSGIVPASCVFVRCVR